MRFRRITSGNRTEFVAGVGAMTPLVIALLPFGLLVGTVAGRTTEHLAAWLGALVIYAGSAQVAVMEGASQGSALFVIVLVGALINLRLLVFSAAMAPAWVGTPLRARLIAAATVIDPTWLVASARAARGATREQLRAHHAGASTILTLGWVSTVTAGMMMGRVDALDRPLSVALPLCLVTFAVPHMRLPGGIAAVAAGLCVAWLAQSLPAGVGPLLAMGSAALAGVLDARRSS